MKRGKQFKKGKFKLPIAMLLCAMLVVGGGLAYQAVADSNIILTPNGGENWSEERQITWDTDICGTGEGKTEHVDLKYSSGGTTLIKSYIDCCLGSYSWDTSTVSDGNSYQIVLYYSNDYSINDNSDNVFTIDNTDPAMLINTLISPNGGEFWAGGSLQTITWISSDISDDNLETNPITLEYYNGAEWQQIATDEANDGSYIWDTVPSLDISTAKVRITATDLANNTASDESDNVFTIDNTDPIAIITTTVNPIKIDALTQTVVVIYDETMDNTTVPAITLTGNSWGSQTTVGWTMTTKTDDTYTATFTHGETAEEIANAVAVVATASGATDLAGNSEMGDDSPSFVVDTKVPTITSATANPDSAKAGTVTVTVVFDEDMDTAVSPTAQITGITGSPIIVTQLNYTGATWTGTFTLVDNEEEKTATISVIGAVDVAGNVMVGDTDAGTFAVDTFDPIVNSIVATIPTIYDGVLTQTVTVTYSETMKSDTAPAITLSGSNWGPQTGGAWAVNDTAYTATFTHNGTAEEATGVTAIIANASGATDLAGNTEIGNTSGTFDIDTKNPTVDLSDDHADSIVRDDDTVIITATFIEGNGIDKTTAPKITIGSVVDGATMTKTDNLVWKYIWNVPSDSDGDHAVSISATDVAGNSNDTATGQNSYTIDNTAPTVALTYNPDRSVKDADTLTITATFNESMTSAPTIAIDTTGTVLSATAMSSSGAVWTYGYDVPAKSDGTAMVTIAGTDVAGNANEVATDNIFIIDNITPIGTVSIVTDPIFDGDLVQEVTVTYNESMDQAVMPTITFGATTVTVTSNGDGGWNSDVYTETFTITDKNEEISGVTVSSSGAKDVAGNDENTSVSATFNIDTKNPTPTVVVSVNPINKTNLTQTVTVTYDESMDTGTEVTPVIVLTGSNWGSQTGGSWTTVGSSVTNNTYTATFTHTEAEEETFNAIASVSGAKDVIGNGGVDGVLNGFVIDTKAPVITVDTLLTNDTTPKLTGTIDDSAATISVTVNSVTYITGITINESAGTWTLADNTITQALSEKIYDVVAIATDLAGNIGSETTNKELTIDITAPTVITAISNPINIANENAVSVTITSDEAGTYSYTISDDNSSTGNITGSGSIATNGTVTLTLNLSDLSDGIITANASVIDGANNTGNAQDTSNKDTKAPTVVISSSEKNPTNFSFIVTITFDEDVSGFTVDDIEVGNGVAGTPQVVTTNMVWSSVITPTGNGEVTVEISKDKVVDGAVNGNDASNIFSITYDKAAPVVPTVSDPAGAIIINANTYTIMGIAEANSFVQVYDSSNAVGSEQLLNNATNYSISVTLIPDTVNNFTVTATDAAENESSSASVPAITEDSTAPTAPDSTKMTVAMNISPVVDTISGGIGAVEGYAIVKVYSDSGLANLVSFVTAGSDGIFGSIDIGDNQHTTVYVTATDAAGNESGWTSKDNDIAAPIGYTVSIDQEYINKSNEIAMSFTFAGAEVGATYNYSIDDTNSATLPVTGPIVILPESPPYPTITDTNQQISDIDVSALDDDTLTLTVYLTDSAGNQGANTTDTVEKDTEISTVVDVTSTTGNGIYKQGVSIDVTVEFSEAVYVSGTPQLELEIGTTNRQANYTGETESNILTFTYTVQAGDTSSDLDYTGTTALALNGGTIKDEFGNDATLTLPAIGAAGSLGSNKNIVIDTTAPADYTIAIDQDYINNSNETAMSFIFTGAEEGTVYNYSVDDDANTGTAAVTGTGNIETVTDQIKNIDVSTLDDGTLTLIVYLTDQAGNQGDNATDTVVKDTEAPALEEETLVATPTNDPTPDYTFSSTEAGAITYSGSCLSSTENATEENNTITFNELDDGTYDDCTITVTDNTGNVSNTLSVSGFIVDTTAPEIVNETPGNGEVTSDTTPLINVDFLENGSGIDLNSAKITVDYTDVTTFATVSNEGIEYTPISNLWNGIHTVEVDVNDLSGNSATQYSWQFGVDPTQTTILTTSDKYYAYADGVSEIKITAQILEEGNPVTSGDVNFTTVIGTLSNITSLDDNGNATAVLTSTETGSTIVTASYNSSNGIITSQVYVTFNETLKTISVTAIPNNNVPADGLTESIISVTILDNGDPIFDGTVNFNTDFGTLNNDSVQTDSEGQATVNLTSTNSGWANVEVSYTGSETIYDWTNVEFIEYDATSPTATQYPADNSTNVAITVNPYIDFSEAMNEASLNNNVKLKTHAGSNAVDALYSITTNGNGTTRVIIIPNSDLDYNTQYYFYIDDDVEDLMGNNIEADSWYETYKDSHEFTTIAEDVPVTSYSIPLNEGWNLISLPLIPNDSDIGVVLAGIADNLGEVRYYESNDWQYYKDEVIEDDLETMEDGKGYWVFMNNADTLIIDGVEMPGPGENLPTYSVAGETWNLIGFKSVEEMASSSYINRIGNDDVIWTYDNNKNEYVIVHARDEDNNMKSGYGYWLYPYGSGYSIIPTN